MTSPRESAIKFYLPSGRWAIKPRWVSWGLELLRVIEMTGYEYEEKCARLLEAKGFSNVVVTPGSGDQGIDVLADKGKEKYGVQCKYYEGTVGNKAVQEAYSGSKFYDCDVALVITNSTLTWPAKELAKKLGVMVWENINAIYLQEHDAEFAQKEQARKKREKEKAEKKEREQKQQELKAFQQWRSAYLSAIKEREEKVQTWKSNLEQSYEKQSLEVIELYDKEKEKLEIQINKLNRERDGHSVKLSHLGTFQFSLKGLEKQSIKEIDTKLADLAAHKLKLEQDCRIKLEKLRFSLEQEITKLSFRAKKEILLPKVPPVVQQMKARFVDKAIQTKGKTQQQIEKEKIKSRIVLELYQQNRELTCTDIHKAIPEVYDIAKFASLVRELYVEGKIQRIGRQGKAYFYLSAQARTAYSFDNIFDFLVQCDRKEIEALLPHSTAKKTDREKLKTTIIEALRGSASGMTIIELHENAPALHDYSGQFISALVRELINSGYVARIEKNGKTYFELA